MKSIICDTKSVQAIMQGKMTMLRKVIKPQPKARLCYIGGGDGYSKWAYPYETTWIFWGIEYNLPDDLTLEDKKALWTPPFHVDDVLYVKEDFLDIPVMPDGSFSDKNPYLYYKADGDLRPDGWKNMRWNPSIWMPERLARLFLQVVEVRVERLCEITAADAYASGLGWKGESTQREVLSRFRTTWDNNLKKADRINYSWDANPWVWVVKFELYKKGA